MRGLRRGEGTCVYCCERKGVTKDHVIASQFFPEPRPSNLITVPACSICNEEKRQLEEYACTSFVAHSSALEASQSAIQLADAKLLKWLEKRAKLRELLAGRIVPVKVPPELRAKGIQFGIALDPKKIEPLIERITRGLVFAFWKQLLPSGVSVKASFDVEDRFLHQFGASFKTHKSTKGELGDRVFAYAYQSVNNDPLQSIWLYGFYDVVYAGACVSPNYFFAQARRNARATEARRRRRQQSRLDLSQHPALGRRRRQS